MKLKPVLLKCLAASFAVLGIGLFSNSTASAKQIHQRRVPKSAMKLRNPIRKEANSRLISLPKRNNARLPKIKHIMSFPDTFHGGRFPQSINLSPNQHFLYLGFDSYHKDGSKVVKYNLGHHHFKTGPTFKGGHAQGVAINNRTNKLWFINKSSNNDGDDHAGKMTRGRFIEVSTKSLKPVNSIKFNLQRGYYFNNTLAFTNRGTFIAVDMDNHQKQQSHSFTFYRTPGLGLHKKWFRLGTVLKHVPHSAIIECLAYNPQNRHLYIESETPNELWSLPINKLLKNSLSTHDIRTARIPFKLEPEGLTFTYQGSAYLMFGGKNPWIASIYKTRRPLSF